jgi:hypothetical protein
MRYLVTLPPVVTKAQDVVAAAGEPVVPWYPAPPRNMFLAVTSMTAVATAVVADIDADPDKLATELHRQLPGLPLTMHQNFVMATALAAAKLKPGTRVRPIMDYYTASIQTAEGDTVIKLWERLPIKERICQVSVVTQ